MEYAGSQTEQKQPTTGTSMEVLKPYQCAQCGRRFTHQCYLGRHQITHEIEKKCKKCGEVFETSRKLRSHELAVHSDEKDRKCETCGKVFALPASLRRHKREVQCHIKKKPRTYVCAICGKKFNRLSRWRAHMPAHSRDKNYECDVCGTMFARLCSLRRHQHQQHPQQSQAHACPTSAAASSSLAASSSAASSSAVTSSSTVTQSSTVTPSSSGTASSAPQASSSDLSLNKNEQRGIAAREATVSHNVGAEGQHQEAWELYRCERCGQTFNQQGILREHVHLHCPNREQKGLVQGAPQLYRCGTCGRVYSQAGDLMKHMPQHSGRKLYQCASCKVCYFELKHLIYHLDICVKVHKKLKWIVNITTYTEEGWRPTNTKLLRLFVTCSVLVLF